MVAAGALGSPVEIPQTWKKYPLIMEECSLDHCNVEVGRRMYLGGPLQLFGEMLQTLFELLRPL